MKRYLLVLAAVLCVSGVANAQYTKGDKDFTLTGGGSSDKSLRDTTASVNAGLGYFLTDQFELGLRQSVSYDHNWSGTTSVFADYNFTNLGLLDGKLDPFVGVSAGRSYGNSDNRWNGGPEIGVKYFVNQTTYLYGSAAYEFDLGRINNGGFNYNIGIGFRF